MEITLDPLLEATRLLQDAWGAAPTSTALSRPQLLAVNDALGLVKRLAEGLQSVVGNRISYESRPELGPQSLARQQGFRNAAQLIATTTGASTGEAARLVKVGEAIAPRTNLLGQTRPSRFPLVQAAMREGRLSAAAASAIIVFLDRIRRTTDDARAADAERALTERAPGLSHDDVRRMITRWEAHLDPDGVAPREDELRARAALSMFERDGMLHINATLDPARGAPVKAAIQGFVSAEFAAKRDGRDPSAPDADRRSVSAIQADALVHLAEHTLTCESPASLNGATVVVRIGLDDLRNGTGHGLIDGIEQPVSTTTVRRMAAGGGVIPWVCGSKGDILDWGRKQRFFTTAQRLALAERDGGCAFCGLPPGMTKAHHIAWWARDHGRTDLDNGVLLCETCHHLIHDNGWDIRVDGVGVRAKVWFLPPPSADPLRTPRLGGRARTEMLV
ncbi:HNH endonuclease [Microbacterium azadirachtae]|uniref:HNH endonuclease n=1 Tax=Microbacterium azadirachtae TaxID=582680 RepID=UPI00088204F5|nr:HNH endonuclease signature motif containing protein [Microbacterium azadirachtae]SDL95458.1 HNH endonuclease [Microbacterium azadirachtae]SEG12678.1 HNH endonuclease [Microbacterium azadirachtae]SEG15278.1 HNH endonuclease [Microbacterium azadirachtae]